MRARFFGCGKFGWLASEAEDRPLSPRESAFMERHRLVCSPCAQREQASSLALNMLREARFEDADPSATFDVRVIRRVRVQMVRASFQYWSPAVCGAAIAAVALVAGLQLLSRSHQLPVFQTGGSDARRIQVSAPDFPELPLNSRLEVDR